MNLKRASALEPLLFSLAALLALQSPCDARTASKDLPAIAERPAAPTLDGWVPLHPPDLPIRRINRENVGELVPIHRLGLGLPSTVAFNPISGDLAVGTAAGLVAAEGVRRVQ